jgi:hypothetical protein
VDGGDHLQVQGPFDATNATIQIIGDMKLACTPFPDFHGVVTFSAIVSDGNGGSTGRIYFLVTVDPVNDAPHVHHSLPDIVRSEDSPKTVIPGAVLSFADVDGNGLDVWCRGTCRNCVDKGRDDNPIQSCIVTDQGHLVGALQHLDRRYEDRICVLTGLAYALLWMAGTGIRSKCLGYYHYHTRCN